MRLSLDFDLKERYLDLLMAYFNLKYFFKEVYVISTRHGVHLRAYPDKPIDLFALRGFFRDDNVRLELDMKRKYIHHIDFFSKRGFRNCLSCEEEVIRFWERKVLAKRKRD
mgnify:CR=1 FL=1